MQGTPLPGKGPVWEFYFQAVLPVNSNSNLQRQAHRGFLRFSFPKYMYKTNKNYKNPLRLLYVSSLTPFLLANDHPILASLNGSGGNIAVRHVKFPLEECHF